MKEFAKTYQPSEIEKNWYEKWLANNIFKADNKSSKPKYSILMPPPNVTGILHFGHVLNHTLQDIYIRRKRMQGFEVCWFPGMDHAGIATQARVEKTLKEEEGKTRYDLGRDKFIERVWQWKDKYGGIIFEQLQRLGISCDWSRSLFTMDESASNAVREVFIRLFDEGLIYKGKRIINWSPLSMTALSDEEVEFKETNGKLYTLKYRFEDIPDEYLKVATVRPETIFGDTAVAVNPKDERFTKYLGKKVIVPLTGRAVPIIADDYADPEFGTGCVKITPAHDPNDFYVGERHNLEQLQTINPDGTLNSHTGEFDGMERFAARRAIVKKLEEGDLIEKIEDYTHNVGYSQRGGEPVEPYLSDQWFVKMQPLVDKALQAVDSGKIKFYPEHWGKTYQHWMKNIRDWCISRQLWWGHRIPVYYTEDGSQFTAASSEEQAREKLGLAGDVKLFQDPDVLDTWFSSWLWPMTTMHWLHDGEAETTDDLKTFLPTDLLVTAPDIIFFWVARMIMATEHFKDEIPFKDVYFTSVIKDGIGRKLSKSLGNSPDPLNIMDKYGTDATRFTMIYHSPLGQDVRLDVDVDAQDIPSIELGRNFANKIWNAGRFLQMKRNQAFDNNSDAAAIIPLNNNELSFADKWMLSKYNATIKKLDEALDNFRVTDYAKMLYDFIWSDFCDWYVEILKIQFDSSDSTEYRQKLITHGLNIYTGILKLLHPVMPFITEEIWHLLEDKSEVESISTQAIPEYSKDAIDEKTDADFSFIQLLVEEIRKLRSSMNIPPQQKMPVVLVPQDENQKELILRQPQVIEALARVSKLDISDKAERPAQSLAGILRGLQIFLLLEGSIDLESEKDRLEKEIKRLEGQIMGIQKKLSNEKFVNNAPQDVVEREKKKLNDMMASAEKIKQNLESIG